jgi:hypothetical protein
MTTNSSLEMACSLTPGDYAQRLREFRQLFATALRETRRDPTRLYLVLDSARAGEDQVRDLLRREQECCPFFTFGIQASPSAVRVEAAVPEGVDECLDDLERMATRALVARA